MRDYEVKTAILLDTGFDDRECNCLLFDERKPEIVKEIQEAFESDETLAGYITSDLEFRFDGYKVRMAYVFSCYDENEQEAESYAQVCVMRMQEKMEELGYKIKEIACKASEMDMEWLDRLEQEWFG